MKALAAQNSRHGAFWRGWVVAEEEEEEEEREGKGGWWQGGAGGRVVMQAPVAAPRRRCQADLPAFKYQGSTGGVLGEA